MLLVQLRNGDYTAFELIYHLYKKRIAKNLFRLLKSEELVEEVLQELFIRLWENRKRVDPDKPIRAFLFKISENLVMDIFRKASRDKALQHHFQVAVKESYSHVEESIYQKESSDLLDQLINLLPPQRRKVFKLCKLEAHSYDEVSKILNISTAAVNDHISKANQFLKNHIAKSSAATQVLLLGLLAQQVISWS